ncbi:hypothetical protein KA478_03210 [Patescibacteria group bacterium]|nr:hypothetical protein [Patescibacteria group bacterium]
MNDPNWEIKTLQHLLQETATHELAMLQLKRKQRITLNHSKYKNKLANIIGLGNAKKDEQETAKREYITKVNKTAAQLGSHKDIKDIATIYVGNDPVSQLIQAKIKEVGTLAVTRANDLTALTTKKEALDLSVQSQQQKLTDTEALLENGLENYEALTEKVYLNNKEYIDRIIGIIQEKVSN